MEHTETEQKGLELVFLMALGFLEVFLWELGEGSSQVGLQVGWGFVGDLD